MRSVAGAIQSEIANTGKNIHRRSSSPTQYRGEPGSLADHAATIRVETKQDYRTLDPQERLQS